MNGGLVLAILHIYDVDIQCRLYLLRKVKPDKDRETADFKHKGLDPGIIRVSGDGEQLRDFPVCIGNADPGQGFFHAAGLAAGLPRPKGGSW